MISSAMMMTSDAHNLSMQFLWLTLWKGMYHDFFQVIAYPTKPTLVFTPNPEMLLHASSDAEFRDILSRADYLVPDGVWLYLASLMRKWRGYFSAWLRAFFYRASCEKKYGELIKGSDLTRDIFEWRRCKNDERTSILIIDSRVVVMRDAFDMRKIELQKDMKSLLEEKYRWVTIHIIFEGDMSPDGIAHYIELQQIRYVFSTLGMKSQEQILVEVFSYISSHTKVVGLGVGASIDFLIGLQKRAPRIFQRLGLEWLYRLARSPRKRWSRIVDAVWRFPREASSGK